MKKLIFVFVIGIISVPILGQPKVKVDGKILSVSSSENYINIICEEQNSKSQTALLYNLKGELIYKTQNKLNGYAIKYSYYIEPLNYLLLISGGFESISNYRGEDDLIQAINIYTGEIIWEERANASAYEISKDHSYLITKCNPRDDDRTGKFQVFELKSGKELITLIDKSYFNATFYGNDRIIFAEDKYESIVPDQVLVQQYEKRKKELLEEWGKLRNMLLNKEITETEYKERESKNIQESFANTQKYRQMFLKKEKNIGVEILIYNLKSNIIELKRSIDYPRNNKYRFYDLETNISLNIDDEENIYISFVDKDDHRSIVKYNKNFDQIWQSEIFRGIIYKYYIEGKPFFEYQQGNQRYMINAADGQSIQKEKFLSYRNLSAKGFIKVNSDNLITDNKININYEENSIELNKEIDHEK